MGGKKNKNKEKGPGLTPAQRKNNARKSLKDQVEIKKTLKSIQEIERDDKLWDSESAKLAELGKQVEEVKKDYGKVESERNTRLCTTFFHTPNSNQERRVDYKKAMTNLDHVNMFLKEDLGKETKKYASWYNACVHMLDKEKIAKEKCQLFHTSDKGKIEDLVEEKRNAESKLKELKGIYQQMAGLDKERQINNVDLTLEEYMTLKHNRSSRSIDELRKLLKQVNTQSRQIQKELEHRRTTCQQISNQIKQNEIASVEEHQRYKDIVEENKKLMAKLEYLNKKQHSVAEEKNQALIDMEREKERAYHESKETIEIEERIKQLRLQHDLDRASEAKYEEILQAAKEQDWAQDVALKHERDNISSLTERICIEKTLVNTQQKQLEQVNGYNEDMLRYVDKTTYKMVEEFHDDGKRHWPCEITRY